MYFCNVWFIWNSELNLIAFENSFRNFREEKYEIREDFLPCPSFWPVRPFSQLQRGLLASPLRPVLHLQSEADSPLLVGKRARTFFFRFLWLTRRCRGSQEAATRHPELHSVSGRAKALSEFASPSSISRCPRFASPWHLGPMPCSPAWSSSPALENPVSDFLYPAGIPSLSLPHQF